ncbi:hypothetical protein EI94DRAFT_1708464, partial [Lactarius quietus]
MPPLMTMLRLNHLTPSHQAFDQLKAKHSLIASDVLKLVKTYFEAAMFVDQSKEIKSPHYIGRYQSAVIIPITKKFLALANGSAILPTIGAQNPPIGLYILILTAVERAYKSFIMGTYKLPTQFSNENVWRTMDEYHKCLLQLSAGQWAQILDSLGLQDYSERPIKAIRILGRPDDGLCKPCEARKLLVKKDLRADRKILPIALDTTGALKPWNTPCDDTIIEIWNLVFGADHPLDDGDTDCCRFIVAKTLWSCA